MFQGNAVQNEGAPCEQKRESASSSSTLPKRGSASSSSTLPKGGSAAGSPALPKGGPVAKVKPVVLPKGGPRAASQDPVPKVARTDSGPKQAAAPVRGDSEYYSDSDSKEEDNKADRLANSAFDVAKKGPKRYTPDGELRNTLHVNEEHSPKEWRGQRSFKVAGKRYPDHSCLWMSKRTSQILRFRLNQLTHDEQGFVPLGRVLRDVARQKRCPHLRFALHDRVPRLAASEPDVHRPLECLSCSFEDPLRPRPQRQLKHRD